jgi:hypothetical protein
MFLLLCVNTSTRYGKKDPGEGGCSVHICMATWVGCGLQLDYACVVNTSRNAENTHL